MADNNWPQSPLWKCWYAWRTELYVQWIDEITSVAHEVWGKNPKWQGCVVSMPPWWYTKEIGADLEKLATVKHLDYLVCGYAGGVNYQKIRAAANRNGKKWGGMIQLGSYGHPAGQKQDDIINLFKQLVKDGAALIYVYPTAAFQTNRMNLPAEERQNGLYYMPEQIAAWETCVKWLETNAKVRRSDPWAR